ncbi:LysR substrate-binding domain-containing protein [Cupriavidus numazuensis]|uniref:LysR substrate-binding domain-containing protein n=1 Tax=Cupriavidus numazuensis TaxID=221992 RepID=UPI001FD1E8CB|nr:LysR substrate-binding domain-containing protein [Cupriavidus numazuensis]
MVTEHCVSDLAFGRHNRVCAARGQIISQQDLHCPLKLRIRVTSFDALCVMVSAGLGIGILPEAIAQRNCATMPLCIVPLSDALARREFLLAVRSMDALPVASQMLVRHFLETEDGTEGV